MEINLDDIYTMNTKPNLTSETIALVMCGGEGTRLRPITYLIRKEMLPIGRNRRPLLEYVVDHMRSFGLREIVFLGTKVEGDEVANYFGDGHRFGVQIIHQPDNDFGSGTGHALIWAMKQLGLQEKNLLIYYGDILTFVDLHDLITVHNQRGAVATLVLSSEYIIPKGIAMLDKVKNVQSFVEKPTWNGPGKVGIGMLCINGPSLLKAIGPLPNSSNELRISKYRDIMGDIVTHLIDSGEKVIGYETTEPWLDIGSFEHYSKVREDISWLTKQDELPATERGLVAFLSYHISKENKYLVEDLIVRCLEAAGMRVICGGKLNQDYPVVSPPAQLAGNIIDKSDVVIAIATPDKSDGLPSDYVQYEVAYAQGKGKLIGLFVEKGTTIPSPWPSSYIWHEFEMGDTGSLVRDILETIMRRK